jgi:hypothetical protein
VKKLLSLKLLARAQHSEAGVNKVFVLDISWRLCKFRMLLDIPIYRYANLVICTWDLKQYHTSTHTQTRQNTYQLSIVGVGRHHIMSNLVSFESCVAVSVRPEPEWSTTDVLFHMPKTVPISTIRQVEVCLYLAHRMHCFRRVGFLRPLETSPGTGCWFYWFWCWSGASAIYNLLPPCLLGA